MRCTNPECTNTAFDVNVGAMFTVETYEPLSETDTPPPPELVFDGLFNEKFSVTCKECSTEIDPADEQHQMIVRLLNQFAAKNNATCEPMPVVYGDGTRVE
jgi:hypothetical protein